MKNPRRFYIYIYFDLCGIPRYVGKGQSTRWKRHFCRAGNPRLRALIERSGGRVPVVIVRDNLTHEEAVETEIAFIRAIGRGKNGPLYNFTDGGEGTIGYQHSLQTRLRFAEARFGRVESEEFREKCRQRMIGFKHKPETIAKMKEIQQKKLPVSDETRAKLRKAWETRVIPPEQREKMTAALRRPKSPEHRKKLSEMMIAMNKARKKL